MRSAYIISALAMFGVVLMSMAVGSSPGILDEAYSGPPVADAVEPTRGRANRYPVVSVERVEERTVASRPRLFGRIVPRDEVLVSPQVAGAPIVDVLVDVGDEVQANQVIAILDPEASRARLLQFDAELAKAEADIAQAQAAIIEAEVSRERADSALARASKLFASGTIAQQNLDDRRTDVRAAEARLSAQRHSLRSHEAGRSLAAARRREAELNLDYTQIKAPAAGIVSGKAAKIGQIASSTGGPLFRIIRGGELEMHAEVVDRKLSLLTPGQTAEVRIAGIPEPIKGRIRLIDPAITEGGLTTRVSISLDRASGVRSGLLAHALVDTRSSPALVVAHSAVQQDARGSTVKVVDRGLVETRRVVAGLSGDGGVAILSGLAEGDLVVVRSGALLRNGDRVIPSIASSDGTSRDIR